jgi:putative tryptophan/tyrosine transport system substrate-binding protein
MRHVGVLINLATDDPAGQARLYGFVRELEQSGWKVGHNLRIEGRNAGNAEMGMSG